MTSEPLIFKRPDGTPLALAYVFSILVYLPFLLAARTLYTKQRNFEAVLTFMLYVIGLTQAIHETHDKDFVWDSISDYQPQAVSTGNGVVYVFGWDQLTATVWAGLDFFQWQKLLAQCGVIVVCMHMVISMQNARRETDRLFMAFYASTILILFEIGHEMHYSMVDTGSTPILFAVIAAIVKVAECSKKGRRRKKPEVDQKSLLKAIVFCVGGMFLFAMRYKYDSRKDSLIRPYYGLAMTCAGCASHFMALAFCTSTGRESRGSVVLT